MLKRFMFASIGVLVLALSFHLGTTSAKLSGVDCIQVANLNFSYGQEGRLTFIANGTATAWRTDGGIIRSAELPRGGTVVDCGVGSEYAIWVLYADGDLYRNRLEDGWRLMANVACGQTAIEPSTWGQIKRQGRGR